MELWRASRLGRSIFGEENHGTDSVGYWVGPRASFSHTDKTNMALTTQKSKTDFLVFQPVACCYTN